MVSRTMIFYRSICCSNFIQISLSSDFKSTLLSLNKQALKIKGPRFEVFTAFKRFFSSILWILHRNNCHIPTTTYYETNDIGSFDLKKRDWL